ncbi:hypothetical protein A5N78_04570 [Prescottella equi]|uniref:hypothetical protein n=1 Tax=Rhodococcus hoagii TaxID=43767 RepID=UPI000A1208A4|nr:hypothetical protein [Prescottella equi]ORL93414.1 hypothetical protein A5N78_04570 [Prescottella equi]ORM17767.1 hypothetical protein A5N70_11145 [Prescottella equi]
MKLRRRPRPDSTAHQIAASMAADNAAKATSIARRRIRDLPAPKPGVVVGTYEIPSTSSGLPSQAVTAAAQVVFGKTVAKTKKRPPVASWQTEAWELRGEIPEFRFAGDRVARGASRYRLFAAKRGEELGAEPTAVTEGLAYELCNDLLGDIARTQQSIHRAAQQLTFNGETMLIVSEGDDDGSHFRFAAHSVSELTGQGKSWKLNDGVESRNITDDEIVIRCHRPDPQHSALADCPAKAVLPVARTLRGLGKRTAAEIDSRLAGAGLLLVPDSISLLKARQDDDPDADPFLEELIENMITPIQDPESAAAVVPMVAKVPAEFVDKIQHIDFSTPLDAKLPEMEESAIRRVALGMDSPPETLLGMSTANHWCVDDTTEVYTWDRGWIYQDQLAIGDIVLTLNHETGMTEWQPVQDIYRADVVDEPMRLMQTQRHNSLTTLDHKWPVLRPRTRNGVQTWEREWTVSEELGAPHAIITGAPHADLPTDAKWNDDLVELVAWYWTEGNLGTGGPRVSIAQSHTVNPERVDRIRAALIRQFGMTGWSERVQPNESSHGGPITVFSLGVEASAQILEHVPGRDKIVSTQFVEQLTLAQLELFIDISCQGDGWHYRAGRTDVWQKNPAALAAFERALILSGRSVSTHASGDGVAVAGFQQTRQRPGKDKDGRRPVVIESYTGVLWCPTTLNHTWFARRNGQSFFTGNTGWLITSEEVTLVLSPTVATICHALTAGFLHPMLQAEGVEDWADYLVWFDASELELRPDKSVDSRELFDKGLLGGAAVLRENGFTDKDAPKPEEEKKSILTKLLMARPELAEKLLPELGIDVDLTGAAPATSAPRPVVETTPATDTSGQEEPPEQPTSAPDDTVETGPGQ